MACSSSTCTGSCNDNSNLLFFILALTALNGTNNCGCSTNNNNTLLFCLLLAMLLGNGNTLSSNCCGTCNNG